VVIGIGDLMQRLTRDAYLAILHRVINVTGGERYSAPVFFDTAFDMIFAPPKRCVNAKNPAKQVTVRWRRA